MQLPQVDAVQRDGKPVQKSAKTRNFAGVKAAAEAKALQLAGKAPAVETKPRMTLETAVEKWLVLRAAEKKNRNDASAKRMGRVLVDWMREQKITFLHEITTALATDLFVAMSKRYRNGDSSSLKTHWRFIKGFFRYAVEQKHIRENPLTRRSITFDKPEVMIPDAEEIERVLGLLDNDEQRRLWLFVLTMRHTGMAIRDTIILSRNNRTSPSFPDGSRLEDGNLVRGNRCKTRRKGRFRVRIPMWLADALRAYTNDQHFFWDGRTDTHIMVMRYEYDLAPVFAAAKPRFHLTPHHFRHFFVSEQLAAGVRVDDVAELVGTSAAVLTDTYKHYIQEAGDRMDAVQAQVWHRMGLDAEGNPKASGGVQ
jgi:site-specific recombinase XerD